jgi:murein DD-endopeptidase
MIDKRRSAILLLGFMSLVILDEAPAIAEQRPVLVQSVDIAIPVAPMPVTIAGKRVLAYELHVTNFRPHDVELNRVEVLDADRGSRLAELSGSQLTATLGRVGARVEGSERQRIPAGGRTIVYLWLELSDALALPARLQHRIELDLVRPTGRERTVVTDDGCTVRSMQPIVLSAPLRGGPWVALYDPRLTGGHRTSVYTLGGHARIPARFAIDWVKLASDATHAREDSTIANWHGYGAEVLAVADAIVADAVDDMAEAAKLAQDHSPLALENASGNHVTLDLGDGHFAFYEHLKHGSISVKRGDRVKRGQVIGLLGNSGSSSTGPHLHFHVGDAGSELAAEGLPYVFRNFEIVGRYAGIDGFMSGQHWQPAPAATGGKRSRELPGANTVVIFPDAQ